MNIKPLASSSEGNAYLINDGNTTLLIECGIPFSDLQKKTGFSISNIDGCLISHSHKDHSFCVKDMVKNAVDCYMSKQTYAELNLDEDENFRYHIVESQKRFNIGTFRVMPLEMNHDVYCLGFLIYSEVTHEKLLFATDTFFIHWRIPGLNYIMIETNYDINVLNERIMNGETDMPAKDRLVKSHMEIENAVRWLQLNDLSRVKRIYLMHLSGGSASAESFKRRVMEATGLPVTVCER